MKKAISKRLADMLLGKPKAHKIGWQPNHKQKRIQAAIQRKKIAAPRRQRFEGRKR